MATKPHIMSWDLWTSADQQAAWDLFADTERFNRAVGLEFQFSEQVDSNGVTRMYGKQKQFGVSVEWEERPFKYEAPHFVFIDRDFIKGPLKRYTVSIKLSPRDGGTRVEYVVTFYPDSYLGKVAVLFNAIVGVRPSLNKALLNAVALLNGDCSAAYDPSPGPLSEKQQGYLESKLRQLDDLEVAKKIAETLTQAPLLKQNKMTPLGLANDWGLDRERVIKGLLQASQAGILELRWEVLCPSCQQGKSILNVLNLQHQHAACVSCNTEFDAARLDGLEVVLRPHKKIRDFNLKPACLGSPQRTPHILARETASAQSETSWSFELQKAGSYYLRSFPDFGEIHLEVSHSANTSELDVKASCQRKLHPHFCTVRPGKIAVRLHNEADFSVQFLLEVRYQSSDVLTAWQLLKTPGMLELIPARKIAKGIKVDIKNSGVLMAQAFKGKEQAMEFMSKAVAKFSPRKLQVQGRSLVATWDNFSQALEAAKQFDGAVQTYCSVGQGPVAEISQGKSTFLAGDTLDRGLKSMKGTVPGGVAIADGRSAEELLRETFAVSGEEGHRLLKGPQLGEDVIYRIEFELENPSELSQELMQSIDQVNLPETPQEEILGTLGGRYELGGMVGKGGFGAVYECIDRDTGRPAVAKVLHRELAENGSHLNRFYHEARILSQVEHENIVKIYDFGTSDSGQCYMVLEKIFGQELHDILRFSQVLDPYYVCLLAEQILNGLREVHKAGLVHRDLKPGNIIIQRKDAQTLAEKTCFKIIDFGIALDRQKLSERDKKVIIGTPLYMSPEQINPSTEVDGRSDLYALGLIIYKCLTGIVPYHQHDGLQIVVRRSKGTIIPLDEASLFQLPLGISDWVQKSLACNPDERFASAEKMLDGLWAITELAKQGYPWPRKIDKNITSSDQDLETMVLEDTQETKKSVK